MDEKGGVEYSFKDPNLEALLSQQNPKFIGLDQVGRDGQTKLYQYKHQRDLAHEFFLTLSTCHECLAEKDD